MDIKLLIICSITLILLAGLITFGIIANIAFKKTEQGAAGTFTKMFSRGNFLSIFTVILIITATIYLSLVDVIKSEGAVTLLSGIAGYVLGNLSKNKLEEPNNSK